MSQTKCPSCGFNFDNQRGTGPEVLRGRLLYGPERLIAKARLDAAAFDTCASCGKEFASKEFRFFGEFARARIRSMGGIYAMVGILAIAMVAAIWLAGR